MKLAPTRMSGVMLVLASAAVLGAPAHASAQDCRGADAKPRGAKAVRATVCLINAERAAAGLGPVRPNGRLQRAAQGYAQEMVAGRFFDHVSPSGSTLTDRVLAAGYVRRGQAFTVTEDLGWGAGPRSTPRATVKAWMASPGHRANVLMADMDEIGVGVAPGTPFGGPGATYAADFGRRR